MHVTKIRIFDYKSYLDSDTINLGIGINLIVGKNNSGKTSLLETLSGKIEFKPHLSKLKKPRPESPVSKYQDPVVLELFIPKEELFDIIEDKSHKTLYFLNDKESDHFYFYGDFTDKEGGVSKALFNGDDLDGHRYHVLDSDVIQKHEKYYLNGMTIRCFLPNSSTIIPDLYHKYITSERIDAVKITKFRSNPRVSLVSSIDSSTETSQFIKKEFFENRVYKFDVHRTINLNGTPSGERQLYSNCTNLPTVLDNLQSDYKIYKEYVNLVNEVFPDIENITIERERKDSPNSTIKIWKHHTERPDLTIPLSDCGTGLGQVMAMLYVVVSSFHPQVIIIDEPNSFLHPSASRKLMEIFKRYNQHQYIISTHSPEIISTAHPENIFLLRLDEKGQTQIQKIDRNTREHMEQILEEVGGRLSDVFGYDQILWVEGQTEELCFPKIVENLLEGSLTNSPIRRVHDTGSFEMNHIQTTLYIYRRLVDGDALIPPSLAFIFDRERRTSQDIEDLKRQGKGKVHFLNRRLYENYLLDFEAIEAVLKQQAKSLNEEGEEQDWVNEVSAAKIETFINECITDNKFWDNKNPMPKQIENWLNEINASKLLESVFLKITETKIPYRKTTHSVRLTEWLIENKPEKLKEITELLSKFYP